MCPVGEQTSQICSFEFHDMWILGRFLGFDMEFQDFTGILKGFYSHNFYTDFTSLMLFHDMYMFIQDQKTVF